MYKVLIRAAVMLHAPAVLFVLQARFSPAGEPPANPADSAAGVRQIVAHRGAMTERPENTLAAVKRAIEVGATAIEMDVRTSKDGVLFLLHDATLNRTTDGTGAPGELTMAELKALDAGGWFDANYRGEKIPTLCEAFELCRGKTDVLLDLKESGRPYAEAVARAVRDHGQPSRTLLGVHTVEQARRFHQALPECRLFGFISDPGDVEAMAAEGVETIRLWPDWLADPALVGRVRRAGAKLHLNGKTGTSAETMQLLVHRPVSLLVDDPATLVQTLARIPDDREAISSLAGLIESAGGTRLVPSVTRPGMQTFLNRDYKILSLPDDLCGMPGYTFDGGCGSDVVLKFKQRAVVLAVFEYNDSGHWTFSDGRSPEDCGWNLLRTGEAAYRGTSNGTREDKPHYGRIYFREYRAGQRLCGLPGFWLCLGILNVESANRLTGFKAGLTSDTPEPLPRFSYSQWATRQRPLDVPPFTTREAFAAWQDGRRREFVRRLIFKYDGRLRVEPIGKPIDLGKYDQQQFHVVQKDRRVFRFFRLLPKSASEKKPLPTLVCFMGHGKVSQILSEPDSYQHACAARFAEHGYLVYAMENVGMGPEGDNHHELDHLLRLDGYSWYGLLFAHQKILLDRVFEDEQVDAKRVGVAGVSTGGLLALSAAAIEPRVAATSVQGIFGSMRVSFVRDRSRHCRCGAIPGLLPEFDLPEMAMMVAPRAIHVSNAAGDGFTPAEAKRCVELIGPLYRQAGGADPLFTVPPGNHEFAFDEALGFFQRVLGKP